MQSRGTELNLRGKKKVPKPPTVKFCVLCSPSCKKLCFQRNQPEHGNLFAVEFLSFMDDISIGTQTKISKYFTLLSIGDPIEYRGSYFSQTDKRPFPK
jgi:hypothetical protein